MSGILNWETLGNRILYVRKEVAKSTNSDFAALLDVSPGTLSSYENDKSEPTASVLHKMRTATNINLDWLVSNVGQPIDQNDQKSKSIQQAEVAKNDVVFDAEVLKNIAGLISLFLAEKKLVLPHSDFINLTLALYEISSGNIDNEELLMTLQKIKVG